MESDPPHPPGPPRSDPPRALLEPVRDHGMPGHRHMHLSRRKINCLTMSSTNIAVFLASQQTKIFSKNILLTFLLSYENGISESFFNVSNVNGNISFYHFAQKYGNVL